MNLCVLVFRKTLVFISRRIKQTKKKHKRNEKCHGPKTKPQNQQSNKKLPKPKTKIKKNVLDNMDISSFKGILFFLAVKLLEWKAKSGLSDLSDLGKSQIFWYLLKCYWPSLWIISLCSCQDNKRHKTQ